MDDDGECPVAWMAEEECRSDALCTDCWHSGRYEADGDQV